MKGVYRFTFDAGRNGTLHGLFTSDDAEVRKVIGKDAYFGEVLGKHSEVQGPIDEDDVELLTTDADFVEKFERYGCTTGFSPWDGIGNTDPEDGE